MEQKKISKATQVYFTDSTTLLGIISPSSLWNTLALMTGFNCGSNTQGEKKKPKPVLLSLTYFAVKITSISKIKSLQPIQARYENIMDMK